MRRSGLATRTAGPALDHRQRRVLGARRRPPRPRPHLAGGEQVDPRHAHHGDARHMAFFGAYAMIVLGDDHATRCRPHRRSPRSRGSRGRATGRSGCRSAGMFGMTHGVRRRRASPRCTSSASSGIGYLETPAQDPGALPDAGGDRRRSSSLASPCSSAISSRRAPVRGGGTEPRRGGPTRRPLPSADDTPTAAQPPAGCRPSSRGGAVLPAVRRRGRRLRALPCAPAAGHAQGPDRLRQDPLRRAHGLAAPPAARDRRVSRRPVGERPGRPLPGPRRRDGLAGRPADPRGARGGDLLSRRGGRGAAGHDRRDLIR